MPSHTRQASHHAAPAQPPQLAPPSHPHRLDRSFNVVNYLPLSPRDPSECEPSMKSALTSPCGQLVSVGRGSRLRGNGSWAGREKNSDRRSCDNYTRTIYILRVSTSTMCTGTSTMCTWEYEYMYHIPLQCSGKSCYAFIEMNAASIVT